MTVGLEMAVVLRARGGTNFLIQTYGISGRMAAEASREAAMVFQTFADTSGRAMTDGSGNVAPGFVVGEVVVDQGRMRVVYRVVNTVLIMVLTRVVTNALLSLQVAEAVCNTLVQLLRSVEVTPDRLAKRYPEVYMAVSTVTWGGVHEASKALADVDLRMSTLTNDEAKKAAVVAAASAAAARPSGQSLKAELRTRLGLVGRVRSSTQGAGGSTWDHTPSSDHRRLQEEADPLSKVAFPLPSDALASAPASSTAAVSGIGGPSTAAGEAAAPAGTAADPLLQATGLDALAAAPGDPGDDLERALGILPGSISSGDAQVQSSQVTDTWAAFPTTMDGLVPQPAGLAESTIMGGAFPGQQSGQWATFGAPATDQQTVAPWSPFGSGTVAMAPLEPALRTPTAAESEAIAEGRALLLEEVWRGSFYGDVLRRAGTFGAVVPSGAIASGCKAEVVYGLSNVSDSTALTKACLRTALLNSNRSRLTDVSGIFVGDFGTVSTEGEAVAFLRYKLPAIACTPPILLRLNAAPATNLPGLRNSGTGVRILLQWATGPDLPSAFQQMTLELSVPSSYGAPIKVNPGATWAAQQHQLRWEIPTSVVRDSRGAVQALFSIEDAVADTADFASQGFKEGIVASVRCHAGLSGTFSGVALTSGMSAQTLQRASSTFRCEAIAHPA